MYGTIKKVTLCSAGVLNTHNYEWLYVLFLDIIGLNYVLRKSLYRPNRL